MAITKTTVVDPKGYTNKSADTTYNQFVLTNGTDNQKADNAINAMTKTMQVATDAQKDAYRIASRKTGETYSTGQPRVDSIAPFVLLRNSPMSSITLIGVNLFINNVDLVSIVEVVDSRDMSVVETVNNISVHQTLPSRLSIDINKSLYQNDVNYYVRVTHNGIQSIINTNAYFIVKEVYIETTDTLNWNIVTPAGQDNSLIVFVNNNPNNFSVTKTRDERLNIITDYEFEYDKNYYLNLNINTQFPNGAPFTSYYRHTYFTIIDSDRVKGDYQDYNSNSILLGGEAGYHGEAEVYNPSVVIGNNRTHNIELHINKGICRIVNVTAGINAVIVLPISSNGKYKLFLYSINISGQSAQTQQSSISVSVNSFSIQ